MVPWPRGVRREVKNLSTESVNNHLDNDMTTKKDASGTPNYVGVVDSGPFPPVKRYDLGTRFYNSLSVPEIVETADGKYVTHDDYLIMVKINDYLQARLVKQAAQMQAIVKAAQKTRAEPVARWAVSGDGSNRGALPLSFTTEDYERLKSIPDGAMLYTTPQPQQQAREPDVVLQITHNGGEVAEPQILKTSAQFDALPNGTVVSLYTTPQPQQIPEGYKQAPKDTKEFLLRAMARNYSKGHSWDHLDSEACEKAADEIRHLRAMLKAAPEPKEPK